MMTKTDGAYEHNTNNQNSQSTKLKNVDVLATRVWTGECSIDHHKNPIMSLALKHSQNSKSLLETLYSILTNNNKKRPAVREREGGKHDIFVAPIHLLRYSRARSTKTKTDVSYISSS